MNGESWRKLAFFWLGLMVLPPNCWATGNAECFNHCPQSPSSVYTPSNPSLPSSSGVWVDSSGQPYTGELCMKQKQNYDNACGPGGQLYGQSDWTSFCDGLKQSALKDCRDEAEKAKRDAAFNEKWGKLNNRNQPLTSSQPASTQYQGSVCVAETQAACKDWQKIMMTTSEQNCHEHVENNWKLYQSDPNGLRDQFATSLQFELNNHDSPALIANARCLLAAIGRPVDGGRSSNNTSSPGHGKSADTKSAAQSSDPLQDEFSGDKLEQVAPVNACVKLVYDNRDFKSKKGFSIHRGPFYMENTCNIPIYVAYCWPGYQSEEQSGFLPDCSDDYDHSGNHYRTFFLRPHLKHDLAGPSKGRHTANWMACPVEGKLELAGVTNTPAGPVQAGDGRIQGDATFHPLYVGSVSPKEGIFGVCRKKK